MLRFWLSQSPLKFLVGGNAPFLSSDENDPATSFSDFYVFGKKIE